MMNLEEFLSKITVPQYAHLDTRSDEAAEAAGIVKLRHPTRQLEIEEGKPSFESDWQTYYITILKLIHDNPGHTLAQIYGIARQKHGFPERIGRLGIGTAEVIEDYLIPLEVITTDTEFHSQEGLDEGGVPESVSGIELRTNSATLRGIEVISVTPDRPDNRKIFNYFPKP
jgi:hypothetical protein